MGQSNKSNLNKVALPELYTASQAIAIVDDDPSVRRGLKRLLQAHEWQVYTYLSAEEFLAAWPRPTVGLALVDIYLPGMSGIELLRRLRLHGMGPPVILMTAHGETDTAEALQSAGQPACLRKPFSLQQLLDAMLARGA